MNTRGWTTLAASASVALAYPLTFHTTTVVGAVTNSATFDTVVNGTSLHAYTEGGLNVFVSNFAYIGFDPAGGNPSTFSGGFHYPGGGATGATRIFKSGGGAFGAIDMSIGTGYQTPTTHLHYWGYNGATLLGHGSAAVASGSKIGFTDAGGITDLYIGAYFDAPTAASATIGSFQAVALDNVRVGSAAPVPEPFTMGLAGLALAAAARRRLRKSA